MSVGQNMRARRKELRMNAETLAKLIGVSPSTVYRYENGDIDKIDSDKLLPIAKALDTTPAKLMGWKDDEPSVDTQLPARSKWIKLSSGTRTIPDEQLDQIYYAAHLVDPVKFPLD